MALKLRMSRGGRKSAPFYRIVVTDSRSPRDGNYLERLGTYDPRLSNDNPNRVTLNAERIKHWLSVGAQPSERVAIFLGKAGIIDMPKQSVRPNKSAPKAKAQERVKAAEEAKAAAAQAEIDGAAAAKAEAEAAASAKVEEVAAAEAPAEAVAAEPQAESAVAEASAAPEAPAQEPAEEPKAE